ncbi:MAG: Membrane-associated zinc metalloprotease [Candidatus Peregrinibacteria bacterium GW2011_GWA2_47_7]|nr:MAG: Membrane-associated zinc metalloprotease [Candidatus Peregrinibacteria bacterium GW2011_GWA2_47_7]
MTSLVDIRDVKLPFFQALGQAYHETKKMTVLTVTSFVKTIGKLVSSLEVPSDIGGPVQIAVYTHTFVQEGLFALVRFAAILSLSLAVINILPIPALDGGRFLFVLIEVLRGGKRISARQCV